MICEACKYNSDENQEEKDWQFWKMSDVFFEFERQEFTDEVDSLTGYLYACPKCFTAKIMKEDEEN